MGGSYAYDWRGSCGCADKQDLQRAAHWLLAQARGRHRRPTPEEIEQFKAWRRMRGGPFGFGGPEGPFGGPRGRGRGRGRARRGDVRLALLRLLAEEPRNGYQLMQTIEERSGGGWSPSPGSVYPTLAQLEDEGLIRSAEAGGARRYEITDAGREHLRSRAGEPDPWESAADGEDAISELGVAFFGVAKAVWHGVAHGDAEQRARAVELLEETRRGLYRILADEPHDGDADDQAGEDQAADDDDPTV